MNNFGFSFGVPSCDNGEANDNRNSNNESQNSEYSSIDYSKIPQPTFKFGQFGQVSADSVNKEENNIDNVDNGDNFDNVDNGDNFDNVDNGDNFDNFDDDSFLAEPSMSAGQFDASFNFQTQPTEAEAIFSPTNSAESLKSSSVKSVPVLVEVPIEEPVYLEEPTPHSVEELMKATVDGDTSVVIPEFFEQVDHDNMEEPAHTIQELLKTENGMEFATESWENVDEEEIKAAEAEFFKAEEPVDEAAVKGEEEPIIEQPVEESIVEEPVVEEDVTVSKEESEPAKPEKKTKTKAPAKAKAVPKAAAVLKAKAAPKAPKKEEPVAKSPAASKAKAAPKTEEPVPLTEGRAKRERKTVERLADSVMQPTKTVTEKVPAIPNGTGMKLGDIEAINHALGRKTAADKVVVMLHKILFNRVGEAPHRKASIRAFCGDESANYETKLKKYTNAELLELTHFLSLTSSKEKALMATKISNFLIKPNLESVKFTAKGERIVKRPKKVAKPRPERSSKRINPDADKKPLGRPPKGSKTSSKAEYLTPETVDSDVESEVEREVLGELNNS